MADGSVRVALWKKGRALSGMPDFAGRCVPSVPEAADSACLWTLAAPDRAALFAGLRTRPANGDSGTGTGEGAPVDLYLRTKKGLECLSAHARGWWKLRSEQAAGETDVFRSEPVPEEELAALHSSLKRVPFENVLCFEADDGSFAGRIDFLTEARLDPAHAPDPPDDDLALFRVAVYEAPVRGWQEPRFVFYATQRMEGSGGTHSYVDITWRHSLGVDILGDADGLQIAALELRCWSVSLPECGLLDWKVPMHLAKWADILHADPPAGALPPWRRGELSFEPEIRPAGSEP